MHTLHTRNAHMHASHTLRTHIHYITYTNAQTTCIQTDTQAHTYITYMHACIHYIHAHIHYIHALHAYITFIHTSHALHAYVHNTCRTLYTYTHHMHTHIHTYTHIHYIHTLHTNLHTLPACETTGDLRLSGLVWRTSRRPPGKYETRRLFRFWTTKNMGARLWGGSDMYSLGSWPSRARRTTTTVIHVVHLFVRFIRFISFQSFISFIHFIHSFTSFHLIHSFRFHSVNHFFLRLMREPQASTSIRISMAVHLNGIQPPRGHKSSRPCS